MRWLLVLVGCAEGLHPGTIPDGGLDLMPPPDLALSPAADLATATSCPVTFRYSGAGSVAVAGEFNNWTPSPSLTLALPPGLHGYKLVVNGTWQLDPAQPLRKWVGGVENSAVRVTDCNLPSLRLVQKSAGHYTLAMDPGAAGTPLDPGSVKVTVRHGNAVPTAQVSGGQITVDAQAPAGKHTWIVEAADQLGRAASLRLQFWVEAEAFEWRDALIYMVMTDRFRDGNPANNPARTSGVDAKADFQGGDLDGVRAAIADGTFDQLGVRALWLSPFHTNPAGSFLADDGVHQVTGYHGYWPVKAREVEPRIGGADALHALVEEAHAHGIRVLQDFVINHVHEQHEYVKAHPDWFRTGCVCGQNGCDWTANRLECQFADYLPDVNWTKPEVVAQYSDDAVWWLDEFDLDGLRVDAVKHVEDIAVFDMTERIRREFESAGNRIFLTGETAMGWSDCGVTCNAGEYGTINRYLGPFGLDGQADFVLYHAVPYRAFAYGDKGMIHVDYWTQQSLSQYSAGAIMTPYIGSHDTSRFVTYSTYRGQDAAHDRGIPGNKWSNLAGPPDSSEPFVRHRAALAWLLTGPGAPLLYYGDEYGDWGGADPNNRSSYRTQLSADETATSSWARALGTARKQLAPLRRGDYQSLSSTEDALVFARGGAVVVALSRSAASQSLAVTLPASIAAGTVLKDRLGGPDLVAAPQVTITFKGAAVYAP